MAGALAGVLLAAGAVLMFAVKATMPGVDVFLVGALLAIAGATTFMMTLMRWRPRRRVLAQPYPRRAVRHRVAG